MTVENRLTMFISLAVAMGFLAIAASADDEVNLDIGHIRAVEGSPVPCVNSSGTVELLAPFSTNGKPRVKWEFDLGQSLKLRDGVSFDFLCRDNDQVKAFNFYFISSKGGCYTTSFVPGKSGQWHRVTIDKSLVRRSEGSPGGWGNITSFAIAAWRGGTNDTSLLLSNVKVHGSASEVVVVRGNAAMSKMPGENPVNFHKFAEVMVQMVRDCGVSASAVPDYDLDAEQLQGAKLVVLPFNPYLPDGAVDVLRTFCGTGGKVFACYTLAKGVNELLGVNVLSYYLASRHPENPPFAGMVGTCLSLAGQPAFFPDDDADGLVVLKEDGSCEVIGRWADVNGKSTTVPAMVRTGNGYHYGGAWSTCGSKGRAMMRAILGEVNPAWRSRFAAAEKSACEAERAKVRYFASQKPKKSEWRAVCCTKTFCDHVDKGDSPFGRWDDAIKFLKDNGFNAILPNYAYANEAYDFRDCLDACSRHGFECHVWKICWEAHKEFPKDFRGRTVVTFKGSKRPLFMCPSDPVNLKSETEMFVNLARRGPTGIHLDYIRYMDQDQCFCDGCRAAFEKCIGRAVTNWPDDVRKSDLSRRWDDFRCDNITALVRAVSKRVRSECPGVQISASVFHTNEESPHKVGQDWGALCRDGLLDFVCPMDYYIGDHFAFKGLVRSHFGYLRDSKAKLRPGIGIACWQNTLNDRENLVEQIKAVRELGLDGFYIFDYSRRMAQTLPSLRMGLTSEQQQTKQNEEVCNESH